VTQLDRLIWLSAAVGEADQSLPNLAVLIVGSQPQMDLDWPVPHTGLAKEGVDLDLVKLIQMAILDHLVGFIN
jgi:hypothetical protein